MADVWACSCLTEQETDVTSIVADMWQRLRPSDKNFWEEEAEKDRKRYRDEMDAYEGPVRVRKQSIGRPK